MSIFQRMYATASVVRTTPIVIRSGRRTCDSLGTLGVLTR
jgi:hypothetical protein